MTSRLQCALACKPIMNHEQHTVYANDFGWCVADSDAYREGIHQDEIVYEQLGLLDLLKANGYDKFGDKADEGKIKEDDGGKKGGDTEKPKPTQDKKPEPKKPVSKVEPKKVEPKKTETKKPEPKKTEDKKPTLKELESMKLKELREIAKPLGLKGTSVKQLAGLIHKAQ